MSSLSPARHTIIRLSLKFQVGQAPPDGPTHAVDEENQSAYKLRLGMIFFYNA